MSVISRQMYIHHCPNFSLSNGWQLFQRLMKDCLPSGSDRGSARIIIEWNCQFINFWPFSCFSVDNGSTATSEIKPLIICHSFPSSWHPQNSRSALSQKLHPELDIFWFLVGTGFFHVGESWSAFDPNSVLKCIYYWYIMTESNKKAEL